MNKKKVVKTTYYSKKLKKYVTKVYTYDSAKYTKKVKSVKNPILVNDKGTINKKNVDSLLNTLKDPADKAEAKSMIYTYRANKEKLTLKTLTSKMYNPDSDNERRIGKLLINLGFTPSEFEKEYGKRYGFNLNDLYNAAWDNNIVTINGVKYLLKMDYYGSGALTPVI